MATSASESVREHARQAYLQPARRQGDKRVEINVGTVHRALALNNRIPLVCQALKSDKFLSGNGLRLVSESGPPSGQSTTVTYTYEFVGSAESIAPRRDAWGELRGALKEVFAEFGGGENYLREERESFYGPKERR